MGEILASVLGRPLERLASAEGPALGAAAAALAGLESHRRRPGEGPYTVAEAVARMVRFRRPAAPRDDWRVAYESGLRDFERRLTSPPS
jgi:sugar (pentulose or hexulose) kinase